MNLLIPPRDAFLLFVIYERPSISPELTSDAFDGRPNGAENDCGRIHRRDFVSEKEPSDQPVSLVKCTFELVGRLQGH